MAQNTTCWVYLSQVDTHLLDNQVQVNGTTLKPGDYKVIYDDSTPNTQVTFEKGKEKVASVPAQLKPLGSKTNSTSLVLNTKNGTPSLDEIHFGGSTQALVLSNNGSSASTQ